MAFFRHLDIKGRLWLALALLSLSTISVGIIAWYGLDRADSEMQFLHRQTLAQVAKSLELSKQSSDIATSAPFLLNYRSQYRINREGEALIDKLKHIVSNWPSLASGTSSPVYAFESEIADAISQMDTAVVDLIQSASGLNYERNLTQIRFESIRKLERFFYDQATNPDQSDRYRRTWFLLQAQSNALSGAVHSKNLLGVGEYQRRHQSLLMRIEKAVVSPEQKQYEKTLNWLSDGPQGLFEVRRRELTHNLNAQNALFRIRLKAVYINDLSARFARNAEDFLARGRLETSSKLSLTKVLIMLAGLLSICIALAAGFFVSRYVTANIEAITNAMVRLAQGDRSSKLTSKISANDEIAKLIQSFRMFRANTLRLDRSHRQLNRKNALFERVFDNINDGVAITSEDGRLNAANQSFGVILKLPASRAVQNERLWDILKESVFAKDAMKARERVQSEDFVVLTGTDGSIIEVRHSSLVHGGGVWLFSDATERKKMEERLAQIRHIEGLGKVSGEVAHDFGNVLSSITANIHLFEQNPEGANAREFIDRINNATEIGSSLVQRLLAFARKQALSPELIDLNLLVEGLSDLISIGLKDGVELETDIEDSPLNVKVDPGQLENAILNLCLNSNQAIDREGRIILRVRASVEGNAVIEVSDNGVGMNETIKERAFEPFYSDRPDGSLGTGLGLPMVYGFIKQSGGDIEIESTPSQGTTIRLRLPLADQKLEQGPRAYEGLRALVIEDDPSDRQAAIQILSALGIQSETRASFNGGEEAIRSDHAYDFILSDLHLDDGKEAWPLALMSIEKRPETEIFIMSGHLPRQHPFSDGHELVSCYAKPLTEDLVTTALEKSLPRRAG
ncbi:ATP-binding protein [uncultured Cohaesibacter sp.]|uniref:ATP-binding protein n=1 Tax=uncultured Cohaesibacter sp. TaxID=1002546 RepID=UPI002AA5FE8A|nr:ATP-binding protein [uncultured Cohaesibacter sp.]